MNCPNCGAIDLRTTETFQTIEQTIRTKKCQKCQWRFTSVEEIPYEHVVIPDNVRRRKKGYKHTLGETKCNAATTNATKDVLVQPK